MAVILTAGDSILIIRNLSSKYDTAPLARLLAIGIGVQCAWETILLITGIRQVGQQPLLEDSLIETNLGMPYIYLIHRIVSRNEHITQSRDQENHNISNTP